ncbi:MAG: squalene/phytoene synthase family protein [Boseongicola sp.]
MSLQACADIVAKGDPDRFSAAMAAPVEARRVLFPLYAFNVEVARAPWVTEEPMIAEMRLQWWRDALAEMGQGVAVRQHEVTTPLAEVLTNETAAVLDKLVEARRWDIYNDGFEDQDHFLEYLDATGGGLMWVAALLLGADRRERIPESGVEDFVRRFGRASAFVRFMQAANQLKARGRTPLVDARDSKIAELAKYHLDQIAPEGAIRRHRNADSRPAILEGWQTHVLLRQIVNDPSIVAAGQIGLSPFRKKLRLLRWS